MKEAPRLIRFNGLTVRARHPPAASHLMSEMGQRRRFESRPVYPNKRTPSVRRHVSKVPEGDIASLGILLMEQGLDVRASLRTPEYDEGSHRL